MKTSKFTEEQVAYALRLSESGTPVADVCRQMGISEATFYVWRKKYADLGVAELRQLRGLAKVDQLFTLTMAAYNLTRLRSLAALRPQAA